MKAERDYIAAKLVTVTFFRHSFSNLPRLFSAPKALWSAAACEEWPKILGLFLTPAAQNGVCGAWRKCGQLCIRACQEF
jgi:hypothetical protein